MPENIQQDRCCGSCRYYRLHYGWNVSAFTPFDYGHCVKGPRVHHCRPEKRACPDWQEQDERYRREYQPHP